MKIQIKQTYYTGKEVKESTTFPIDLNRVTITTKSFDERAEEIYRQLRKDYSLNKKHSVINYKGKTIVGKKIVDRTLAIYFKTLIEVILTEGDKIKVIKINDIILPDNYKQVNVNVHYLNNTCDNLIIYVDKNITLKELSEDTRLIRSYLCKSINGEIFDKPRYKAINMPKVTNIEFYE